MCKQYKIIFIFLLLPWMSSAQIELDSIIQTQDGLNQAQITFKLPITKNLSLNNGMNASYVNSLMEINFPIFLQYDFTGKFQLFGGGAYKYESVDGIFFPYGAATSGIYSQIGIRYNFNERVYGKVMYERPFNNQRALNFGRNPNGNIKFSTGFSF